MSHLPDFSLLCETGWDDDYLWLNLLMSSLLIVRRDRNGCGGGVVLMALKQYQIKECVFAFNNYNIESVWCECKLGGDLFVLGCIFWPPGLDLSYLEILQNA